MLKGFLRVKIGTICRISLNLNDSYSEGTRVLTIAVRAHSIAVIRTTSIDQENCDDYVWLPRRTQAANLIVKYNRSISVTRTQFPVAPCFGIKVDNSYSTTLAKQALDLLRRFHSHGHCYVAFSRCPPGFLTLILKLNQERTYNRVNQCVFNNRFDKSTKKK